MGEIFYLDFLSDGFGKVLIQDPIDYGNTFFELKQKDKGYGRDISFAGDESNFQFSYYRDHYLEKLLYYNHRFGFEAKVNLIIEVDGIENIVGELDFATATTDDLEYFKCKVIQNGEQQILKRRRETKVDVMSSLNVDGDAIIPLVPQNMLLRSKPIYQTSEWSQSSEETYKTLALQIAFPLANSIIKSEINDTLLPISNTDIKGKNFADMQILKAKTKLSNIVIDIKNLQVSMFGGSFSQSGVMLKYGKDFDTATPLRLSSNAMSPSGTIEYSLNKKVEIPFLNNEDSVWLYIYVLVWAYNTNGVGYTVKVKGTNITAKVVSVDVNSVTPSFRLIDVMRQVVKSTSGLDIIAPRFDIGGEFYDNRLFNGNFLRNITKNGFKISLEDIEKSLPELNCDYEIAHDGRIFFGTEKDFYTNIECGFFNNTQFSGMNKMANPRFTVNEFWFMYKRFQSLKENEEVNSADVIHGESKMTLFNKRVENKKEVSIEWCRDAFLIEDNRRKALEISESTASQNDDDVFAIDTVDTIIDEVFNEISELQHTVINTPPFLPNTQLSLKSNNTKNFVSMGIAIGSVFNIKAPDQNAREYTVYEVSNNELKLSKNSGANLASNNDGVRSTSYSYTLDKDNVPFTNYTNQNITAFNLQSGDSYSNLRYSIGRNIWNYWKEYIATCNVYWKDKKLQNTWYKNNPECSTVYQGKTIVEGEPFDTSGVTPILSPFLYNDIVFANVEFEDFIELQKRIRTDRGFIRCIDKNDKVIKVYPIDMKWSVASKQLTIKAEDKYEPINMTIKTSNTFTLINNETRVMNLLWKIEDDKISIFDMNRYRLYNPVFWDVCAVNGAIAVSLAQLKEWLTLIGTEIE